MPGTRTELSIWPFSCFPRASSSPARSSTRSRGWCELPVPLWLYQGLIERLMAKDPKQRYKDADEFIADLDGLAPAER